MGEMLDKLSLQITSTMKEGNPEKLSALRYLKSVLIENKTSKQPKEEIDVVVAYFKKMKDSISEFPEGHPNICKIQTELEYLKVFMPEEMSIDEVKNLINSIISKLTNPNMGMVMKELTPQIKGRFDGKSASSLVMEMLKK